MVTKCLKTTIGTIILLILFLPIVTAIDACQDYIAPQDTCRLITPSITCDNYNYTITTTTGENILNGTLTQLNNTIYYTDITLDTGDYIVTLCDLSTRELYVGRKDETMAYVGIILSYLGWAALLLLASYMIKDNKLAMIKMGLFIYGVITVFILGMLPMIISLNPTDATSMSPVTIGLFVVNVLMALLFVWLYGYQLIHRIWDFIYNNAKIK